MPQNDKLILDIKDKLILDIKLMPQAVFITMHIRDIRL